MCIAVTGATGLIGSRLCKYLSDLGYHVIGISRSAHKPDGIVSTWYTWDQLEQEPLLLTNTRAIVNLAGESISRRWTPEAKQQILESRLSSVRRIGAVIRQLPNKPVLVNGSAIGIYGTSERDVFTEQSPTVQSDFLSHVVTEWENEVDAAIQGGRIVKLRTGIVLDRVGGALPSMMKPFRFGIGGPVGSGRQWMSWIAARDLVRLIEFCIVNESVSGPINAVAPEASTNREFGRTLARVMRRPFLFPAPASLLRIVLGEMSELVLKGQHVKPEKALQHGFRFEYPELEPALRHVLGR